MGIELVNFSQYTIRNNPRGTFYNRALWSKYWPRDEYIIIRWSSCLMRQKKILRFNSKFQPALRYVIFPMSYFKLSLLILIAAAAVDVAAVTREIQFEELRDGLNSNSLLYIDVRRRGEVALEGKVVGSVNIPCKFWFVFKQRFSL